MSLIHHYSLLLLLKNKLLVKYKTNLLPQFNYKCIISPLYPTNVSYLTNYVRKKSNMLHFRKKISQNISNTRFLNHFLNWMKLKKIGEEKQNKLIQFIKILAKLCAFNKGIIFHQILCFFYITGYCWIYIITELCVLMVHIKKSEQHWCGRKKYDTLHRTMHTIRHT